MKTENNRTQRFIVEMLDQVRRGEKRFAKTPDVAGSTAWLKFLLRSV